MSERDKRDEAQIFKDMQYRQQNPGEALGTYQQESRAAQKAGQRVTPTTPSPLEEKLPLSQEELDRRQKARKRIY